MKTAIVALGALATLVAAQEFPQCAELCLNNMNDKASELGCDSGDREACLCKEKNWLYGIRDCTSATCPKPAQKQAVEAALVLCAGKGVKITDVPSDGSASATDGSGETKSGNGGNGGSVSTIYSTMTSDGSTMTTAVATTTLGGAASTPSSDASPTGTPESSMDTVSPSGSETQSGSASSTQSGDESEETSEGGSGGEGGEDENTDESGDSEDAANLQRAAPFGVIAAAGLGLAALML